MVTYDWVGFMRGFQQLGKLNCSYDASLWQWFKSRVWVLSTVLHTFLVRSLGPIHYDRVLKLKGSVDMRPLTLPLRPVQTPVLTCVKNDDREHLGLHSSVDRGCLWIGDSFSLAFTSLHKAVERRPLILPLGQIQAPVISQFHFFARRFFIFIVTTLNCFPSFGVPLKSAYLFHFSHIILSIK